MSELSFFSANTPFTLGTLAAEVPLQLPAATNLSRLFHAVAALDRAGPADIAAFGDGDDIDDLRASRAGACFVTPRHVAHVPAHTIALVTAHPWRALARVADVVQPSRGAFGPVFERAGVDPAAIVHSEAMLEQGVVVEPGVVVGPRAEIGLATRIGANSVVGAGVRIGRGCTIDAQVSIACALIGDRVTICSGARIGVGDSAPDAPRLLGRVIIQDDVTIGANAVVERGHLGDTMIGERAGIATLALVRAGTRVARQEHFERRAFPPGREMV